MILLMALVVAACESAAPATTTTTEPPTTTTATTTLPPTTTTTLPPTTTTTLPPIEWDYALAAERPVVALIDPGAEPRQLLEFDLQVGDTSVSVIRQSIALNQSIGGEDQFSSLLDASIEVNSTVVAVEDGEYTIEMAYGPYTIHTVGGLAGSYAEQAYERLATASGELEEALQFGTTASTPFPSEPIGVGGMWQVDADVLVNGQLFHQTTVVTVVAIESSSVELEFSIDQSLEDFGIVAPGLEVLETTMDSEGVSSVVIDIAAPPPHSAVSSQILDLDVTFSADEAELVLTQHSEQAVEVTTGSLVNTSPVVIGDDLPFVLRDQTLDMSATGLPAPQIAGFDFDGNPVSITTVDGRAKAIVFLAHWCPHCQREVEVLVPWLEETGGVEGVDIYSVATAIDPDRPNYPPSTWLGAEGWNVPVIVDDWKSSVYRAYGAGAFPFWVFVSSKGTIALRVVGELEIDDLVEILEGLE